MKALRVPLAVIGAGPAGLEAAATAAEHGLEAVLIDAQERVGGQYYRQPPVAYVTRNQSHHQQEGQALAARAAHPRVHQLSGVTVWGIFPAAGGWELSLDTGACVAASYVILATGAYDRPIPFPGWTLPGVMTAGGVQTLLNAQQVLPGRRFLLSGTGPLQLAVAAGLIRAGGKVVAVLEGAQVGWHSLPEASAVWGQWSRLAEGWSYGRTLVANRAPLRIGWGVVAAHGKEQVEAVTVARLDRDWRPIPRTEARIEVDTLVTGFGFIPSTELSQLAGCAHHSRSELGGPVPRRDENLLTTQPGVYVAGDAGGIAGAAAARIEGRLAALEVCRHVASVGRDVPGNRLQAARLDARRRLARERRFAAALAGLFTPGAGLDELVTDDTLICRCENVTLGQIRKTLSGGACGINEVKGLTCASMGLCQGRICGTVLPRLVARELAVLDRAVSRRADLLTVRPPVHPLRLETLSQFATALEDSRWAENAR